MLSGTHVIMISSVIAVAVVWFHYLYVKRRRVRALEEKAEIHA